MDRQKGRSVSTYRVQKGTFRAKSYPPRSCEEDLEASVVLRVTASKPRQAGGYRCPGAQPLTRPRTSPWYLPVGVEKKSFNSEQDHLHQDLMLTSAMLLLQCHVFLYSWALPLPSYCNSTYSTGMDRKALILWLHRCHWEPFENLLAYWPLSCPPVLKQFWVRTYSSCFIFYSFRVFVWTWGHNPINSHTHYCFETSSTCISASVKSEFPAAKAPRVGSS